MVQPFQLLQSALDRPFLRELHIRPLLRPTPAILQVFPKAHTTTRPSLPFVRLAICFGYCNVDAYEALSRAK